MTAVPKPPDGYATWLDAAAAMMPVLGWEKHAASELSALRSRLSAAEARAKRLREALESQSSAERRAEEAERDRDAEVDRIAGDYQTAARQADSAESRLAVAVEALEKMADLPHHPATDPYVMGNMATMALARIAAMGKQEPTSEPRGVVNTPDAVPERPSAEESQVANPAGAPPSSPAPPPAERLRKAVYSLMAAHESACGWDHTVPAPCEYDAAMTIARSALNRPGGEA